MPKVVSIHSYRGGTGKSNFTANLATTVAMQGHRVGVIDTDLPSPGIHNLFCLEPEQIEVRSKLSKRELPVDLGE